jgi:hypothetical protein
MRQTTHLAPHSNVVQRLGAMVTQTVVRPVKVGLPLPIIVQVLVLGMAQARIRVHVQAPALRPVQVLAVRQVAPLVQAQAVRHVLPRATMHVPRLGLLRTLDKLTEKVLLLKYFKVAPIFLIRTISFKPIVDVKFLNLSRS